MGAPFFCRGMISNQGVGYRTNRGGEGTIKESPEIGEDGLPAMANIARVEAKPTSPMTIKARLPYRLERRPRSRANKNNANV